MVRSMKKYLIFISFIILLSACDNEGNSFRQNRSEVEFGNYTNMRVSLYDTVLIGSYNREEVLNYDIDDDDIDDISFESTVWGSPGIGQHPRAKISCMHENAQLHGYLKNDTSFLHTNINVNNGPDDLVEIYENLTVSCHQWNESDSILNIEYDTFKLLANSKTEVFSSDDLFKTDTIVLTNSSYGYPAERIQISADTVKYIRRYFDNDCSNFPQDQICYVGIKLSNGKNERLGWIKLSISQKFKIYLLETAIQK